MTDPFWNEKRYSASPMEAMPRFEKLVYAGWVDDLIKGGNPGESRSPAHIPGQGIRDSARQFIVLERGG